MEYDETYRNRENQHPLRIHLVWVIGEVIEEFIKSLGDRSLDLLSDLLWLASSFLETLIWLIPSDVFFFLHVSFWEEMQRKLVRLADWFDSMFLYESPLPKRYVHVLCAPPTASQELALSLALHLATTRADTVMVVLPPKPARRGEPGVGEFHVAWAARRAELLRQRGGNDGYLKPDGPEVNPSISSITTRRRRFSWNWTGRIGMSQSSDVIPIAADIRTTAGLEHASGTIQAYANSHHLHLASLLLVPSLVSPLSTSTYGTATSSTDDIDMHPDSPEALRKVLEDIPALLALRNALHILIRRHDAHVVPFLPPLGGAKGRAYTVGATSWQAALKYRDKDAAIVLAPFPTVLLLISHKLHAILYGVAPRFHQRSNVSSTSRIPSGPILPRGLKQALDRSLRRTTLARRTMCVGLAPRLERLPFVTWAIGRLLTNNSPARPSIIVTSEADPTNNS